MNSPAIDATDTEMQVREQDPSDVLDYPVDFTGECVRFRMPDTAYAVNTCVRPFKATGLQYKATTAGRTGTQEPRWPETAGQTVTDGSVVWTAEAASSSSMIRQLASATWSPDNGVTASGASTDAAAALATAKLSGGVAGQSYLVRVAATFTDGNVRNHCFTLRIARPSKTG